VKGCCWFDSVARATIVARVYDEGDKSRGQLVLRGSSTRATGVARVFDEGDESRGPAARATSVATLVIRLKNWLNGLFLLECRSSVK
jgi:hypothetical protein